MSIYCIIQWQNVHLALLLLPSANVHSLKENTNGFKPNGETPSEVTSTSLRIQLYSFPPSSPHPCAQRSERTEPIFVSAIFRLIVLASQCCLKRSLCLFYTHLSRNHNNKLSPCLLETWQLSTYILRDFSLKSKQKKENKSILLSCIYESICLNIEKMYMLTNLWQNILCKAQYLKLQYFWFLKQEKKNISEGLQNVRLALHQGSVRQYMLAGLALQTCNELQNTGSGHAESPEHRRFLRIVEVGQRGLWTQSSDNIQLQYTSPSAAIQSQNDASSDISTVCRTESWAMLYFKISVLSS